MSEKHLYTVGYEGAVLGDFIATLKAFGIKQIIDVRDLPLSRKRGFSKNALASALAEAGIRSAAVPLWMHDVPATAAIASEVLAISGTAPTPAAAAAPAPAPEPAPTPAQRNAATPPGSGS